jgi:pimeloyl-ACP methyl ester carboxylesterase
MPPRPMRDVMVLLPGITGSVLRKDGREVWAVSPWTALGTVASRGGSIQALALPPGAPADVDDGVTAPRLMPDVHIIPGLWRIDGYSRIVETITRTFDVRPGQNFFEFPYDWRRDNRVAADRLARTSDQWLRAWRKRSGNDHAKLILVAHSMGGLIARYFLEPLNGWASTRMLVTFGTPYRGSVNALDFIANGIRKKLGPVTLLELTDLLRSFDSVYQLLPVYPCLDTGDGSLLRITEGTGVPGLDRERAVAALRFHQEIAEAVRTHEREQAYLDNRYSIHPIVGTFQPTSQSARLEGGRLRVLDTYAGEDQDGDGTVPRVSATPLELSGQRRETYVATRHASLQNGASTLVQLAGLLADIGLDLTAYYGLNIRLRLDIDDVFTTTEPVTVRAKAEDERVGLRAIVVDTSTGRLAAQAPLTPSVEGWNSAELGPLAEGNYRVTVGGDGAVDPVSDVFAILA